MAEETEVKVPQFIRSEDFTSVYSNFTKFEPTLWDLKLLFGEIVEQNAEGGVIENHTAVSMAWSSAKLMALSSLEHRGL